MVESSGKTCSTEEGNGKPLQYSCLGNPTNSMKRQKDRTLKDELSRNNEEKEPKQKQHPVVDVTGDGSKIRCCKEQYCIGTRNVRSVIKANWKWSNEMAKKKRKDIPI